MRNLNKDEKKYINDQLAEKIRALAKIHSRENLDELVKKDVLSSPMVKDAISFLTKRISKDIVKEFSHFEYYITKGSFEYYNDEVIIKVKHNLSTATINEIAKFEKLFNTLRCLDYDTKDLNFEKYYIMFGSWTAPKSERFNKINELIELIYKDLIA